MMSIIKTSTQAEQNNANNDASQLFACIPIGSTVVIQWEDRGLWIN